MNEDNYNYKQRRREFSLSRELNKDTQTKTGEGNQPGVLTKIIGYVFTQGTSARAHACMPTACSIPACA